MPHPWPVFPPEENYTALTSGTGPATTLASAAAFSAEAAQLQSVMATSMVTGVGTYASWQGSAAAASAVTQTGLNTQHELLVGWVLEKPPLVTSSAEAYQTAVAMMVPAELAVANRMEEATDEQINPLVWGALTPRIVALNLDYFGHMWPRNAGAGASYGAALRASAAAMMVPPPPAVAGASVAAPAIAAAAVAENAALSAAGAAMQAAEQGAMAVVSPGAAAPAAALGAVTSSASSVSSTPALPSAPPAQPLAAVHRPPAVAAPSMAPAQAPVGMFAQPPSAAVIAPPSAPNPVADSPVAQPMTPRPGPVAGAVPAAPGVTSFVPPAQPFSPAPPSGGRAGGLKPGMLNASALRGSVTTAPLTTSTSIAATATQPLAYVHPEPPRPTVPPTPPQPPLLNPGNTAQAQHQQPPTPFRQPPPPLPTPQPPAPQSGPPPGPSTGSGGTNGSGGPGAQMLGSGPGQTPQAPPLPIPLSPQPPVPPPSPSPGDPPLRSPSLPSWVSPPVPQSVQAALDQLTALEQLIQHHNLHPPDSHDWEAVAAYNSEAAYYNAWAAQLHGQLDSSKAQYTPATSAKTVDTPSWTQPAPQQPVPQGPKVPQKAQDVLKQIDEGKWPQAANAPGTKGGRPYLNTDQHLPTTDASGKPITYQEWDVNPRVPGHGRGDERIVTGSDGSAWYSPDHYATFQRLR
jgi:guanyl-specific ribonuclease Sa